MHLPGVDEMNHSKKMDIAIVETTDSTELARMNETVQTWHHQNYPAEFKPYHHAEIAEAFERMLTQQDYFALVAKSDGESIGYLLGCIKRRPEPAFQYEKAILHIDQIAVVEGHRKQGIGQRLLEAASGLAKEQNISEIQLDHWAGNELAEQFFSQHGFVYFNHRMRR